MRRLQGRRMRRPSGPAHVPAPGDRTCAIARLAHARAEQSLPADEIVRRLSERRLR